jgi:hypothetical protein
MALGITNTLKTNDFLNTECVFEAQEESFPAQLLTAQEHFDLLHPPRAYGVTVFWEQHKPSGGWKTLRSDSPNLPEFLADQQGQQDRYLTVNEFYRWRVTNQLKSLRACYVDIDGNVDIDKPLLRLAEMELPEPSFVIYSGRGMHLYWLIKPVPAKALPVWQMVQNKLVEALIPIGADPVVKDCTRVLRLCGTINSKNGVQVTGKKLTGKRWTLHQLSDAVLGKRPEWVPSQKPRSAQVHSFSAKPNGRKKYGSIYQWWSLVHQDLMKIGDYYLPSGGIPEGRRDIWLFLTLLSLSWFVPAARVKSEMLKIARRYTPGLMNDVQRQMLPIIKRAEASMRGEKIIFNGKTVDPRYQFKRETLFEWIQEIIPAELQSELRAIIPNELRTQRRKERDKARPPRDRMKEGRYQDRYTKDGVRESNREKREQARQMRAEGMTFQAIATALEVSPRCVVLWTRIVESPPSLMPAPSGSPRAVIPLENDCVQGGMDRTSVVPVLSGASGGLVVESDYLGESERFGVVFPVSSHCLGLEEPLSAVLNGLNGILTSWLGWLVWLVFLVVLRL